MNVKFSLLCSVLVLASNSTGYAAPQPVSARPADDLPEHVLAACDDLAKPFGAYEAQLDNAVDDLSALGVFSESDFHDVKLGFCDFKAHNGPVGTTSCARDIILLDKKYRHKSQRLVLGATLAHEMKHYLQHQIQKAKFGEAYCSSDAYASDKGWMEEEADAFGNAVGEMLFIGRPIEIKNRCAVTVSVHLGTEEPTHDATRIVQVAPNEHVSTSRRSRSRYYPFFAKSVGDDELRMVWRGASIHHGHLRQGSNRIVLSNMSRDRGPFELLLSCEER